MANPCECATGLSPVGPSLTGPVGTENPPGSTRLRYRVGIHGTFKEAMRLAAAESPGLAPHTSRDDSSAAIAFIDTAAVLLEILTFYNERFINEGFLATATERLSLLELARGIGYELKPGVAASTHLAFDVQISPGMPETVQIEPGVQVQSIPLPGQLPRVFETVESVEARPEWNFFKAKQTRPQIWESGKPNLTISGAGLNLPLGSRLLVMYGPLSAGNWEIVEIAGVLEDYERKVSTYTLAQPMAGPSSAIETGYPKIYRFSIEARAFGSNAPDWRSLPASSKRAVLGLGDDALIPPQHLYEWPNFVIHLPEVFSSRFDSIQSVIKADLGYTMPFIDMAHEEPLAFSFFPKDLNIFFFDQYRASTLSMDQEYKDVLIGSFVYLDDPAGTALVAVEGVETISRSAFALSGKSTIITADADQLATFRNSVRSLTVLAGSRELAIAEETDPTALSSKRVLLPSGLIAFPAGRVLSVEGVVDSTGESVSALMTVKSMALHSTEDAWDVEFAESLPADIERSTALWRGNLVAATEGQSRVQVLGHGDARESWVEYQLAAGPLTYVSSATSPRGVASTLHVSVDGIEWREVDYFHGAQPDDEIYTVRANDAGASFVRFGDGSTGSRLPTATNNLKAKYRTNLGAAGNLPAGRLNNLMTRPLGLQGVNQPRPASGGEDPEQREDARENAPLSVKALGRLVSLSDYADFARVYAGIAKSHAAWGKFGRAQGVLLTIAGAEGAEIPADSDLGEKFADAVQSFRDATVLVQIVSYAPRTFSLSVRLYCDARFDTETIIAEARAVLEERYSFRKMHLGEGVTASTIITLLQNVAGVVGVDLDYLHLSSSPATREMRLPARGGYVDRNGTVFPAELLTLDTSNLSITVAAPTP
jgi:Baseplate J-like protein